MTERRPMAFMSYTHVDDEFNRGRLTEFSQCLSREVSLHLGDDFPIFLDRKDIKWGDLWKVRIGDSIDCTTFLIPIITPTFFKSQYCRDELNRFLDRERKLGRNDLILPVYFIHTPLLHDESKRNRDDLAQTIASRQYADWRKLRHKKFDSEEVCEALDNMAVQIREALESLPPDSEEHALESDTTVSVRNENKHSTVVSDKNLKKIKLAATKPKISTIVVDQMHQGDFATISQAISAADPGSRILVKSGIYDEGLVLDKPLEIVGDGSLGEVVIRAEGKNAVSLRAAKGKVSNLVLKQVGGGDFYCVDIQQGVLELEGCDITSNALACVAIYGEACPKLRGNKIHDGKSDGIKVYENGQGLIKDNDIFGNASTGIAISEAGNPIVRGNKIHENKSMGIYVYENGQGLIEDNDIFGNASTGIAISEAGNPIVRGNRINKNIYEAVWVFGKGAGIIENNDLRNNKRGAWDISKNSKNMVKHSGNQE